VAVFNNPAKEPADFQPSIHVRKSRVWTLRQFFHFLTLHRIVAQNIATALPYPKIEKTVPQFLTTDEYHQLINYFCRVIECTSCFVINTIGQATYAINTTY
jgi:site-specific recombinase XerD